MPIADCLPRETEGTHSHPEARTGTNTENRRPNPEPNRQFASHESRVPRPEELARHFLNDSEAEFRFGDVRARLSETLRRLCESLHPKPIQARTARGFLYVLKNEFERLRPDPVWFDRERRAMLRQDLGLGPLPADFETPELPEELLDPRSRERRRMLRDTMRKVENASWRETEVAEWEERRNGVLLRPEEAAEIESGRLTLEEWRTQYVENS